MKSTALEKLWLETLLLSLGIALAGWFVGQGFFNKGRSGDRFVTVKGLAEREVEANLALWPLQFVATDDDVRRAQSTSQDRTGRIDGRVLPPELTLSEQIGSDGLKWAVLNPTARSPEEG